MSNIDQNNPLEVVEQSSLEVMERASIDIQITTAKKYPRSLQQVKSRMLSLATLDEETARGCFFTLPARKGGDGKPIQGPSVRMAEIALASYGHIRAGARVIANDGKVIVAQGVVHDLENNVCISTEIRQRITTKDGRTYGEDMQVMAGNAACSKALRNATFRVVPFALIKPVYEQAKRTAIGDAKTLGERRAAAVEYFVKMGVSKPRIFAALDVTGVEDITLNHLEVLQGFRTAIADAEATIEETFPDPAKAPPASAPAPSGPSAGVVASADGPKKEDSPKAESPAAAASTETPAPKVEVASPEEREKIIADLKNAMLDAGVSEERLFGYATKVKLAPSNVDELFALPTDTLSKLKYALPALKGSK